MGAPLADQDVAGQHELPVAPLHAQTLGLGIAAVTGGADALLVGEELNTDVQHGVTPPNLCVDKRLRREVQSSSSTST